MATPPSLITTSLTVDPALQQVGPYRVTPEDRQYIDNQVRGCERHLVELVIAGTQGTWVWLDAASATATEGHVVTLGSSATSTPTVTLADAAALAIGRGAFGVVLVAASPGSRVKVATGGILPPSLTGLAASAAGFVRVNTTTARCERVAALVAGDYGLGTVDTSGYMCLRPATIASGDVVPSTRQIISGNGLTGGGDLTADRTLAVGAGAHILLAADTVGVDATEAATADKILLRDELGDGFVTALHAGTAVLSATELAYAGEASISVAGDDRITVDEFGTQLFGVASINGDPLPIEPGGITRICCMGDSFTVGPSADLIAGYREALWAKLRPTRSNFRFVGSVRSGFTTASFGITNRTILGDWHHEGHSGQQIAAMASYTAAMANSDIILLIIGTNDAIAGQTGAQMLASMTALLVTIAANIPASCVVLISKISHLYAPVASPGTKNTEIDTYNAGLAALAAVHGPNFRVVSIADQLEAGSEMAIDGIHYNVAGGVRLADLGATEIQRVAFARGAGSPRRFTMRPGGPSVDLAQGATDTIVIPYGAGLKAGTGSFTAAIWFRPHPGLITGDHVLMQYGVAHADGWLVAQNGRTIKVYVKGVLEHTSFACLTEEQWHRVVVVLDAPNLELRLYVTREGVENDSTRGHLVFCGAVSAPWNVSVNEATTIGFTAATQGVRGLVDGYVFCAGEAAEIGDVERDYYDGIAFPGATASYALNEGATLSVDDAPVLGGPTGTITTGAGATYVWHPQPSSRIELHDKPFDEPATEVRGAIELIQDAGGWSLCLRGDRGVQLERDTDASTGHLARVNAWNDGSGLGNNFGTFGATPVLFNPLAFAGTGGLEFDGVTATLGTFGAGTRDVLFTDMLLGSSTGFTAFCAFEAYSSTSNSANAYENTGILVNDNGQISLGIRSGNVICGVYDGAYKSVSAPFRVGKPTIVAFRLDAGFLYVQVDDDAESAGVACGTLTNSANYCRIGKPTTTAYFHGLIGAIMIAPTVLTLAQRTAVRTQFKQLFARHRPQPLVADLSGNVLVPNSTATPGTPLAAGSLYSVNCDGTWKSDTPTVTTFGP